MQLSCTSFFLPRTRPPTPCAAASRTEMPQLPASRPPQTHLASHFSRIKPSPTSCPVSSALAVAQPLATRNESIPLLHRPANLTHNHCSIFDARTDLLRNPPFWLGPLARAQNATTRPGLCCHLLLIGHDTAATIWPTAANLSE